MDNLAIRSSMVAQQSSKTKLSSSVNLGELSTDYTNKADDFLTSINLDRRNVAIAGLNSYWVYTIINQMQPEWNAVVDGEHIAQENILFTRKPNSVLFTNADMFVIPVYKSEFPESTVCVMNNYSLFLKESIVGELDHLGWRNEDAYEYDVIDREDLGVEKFDMIVAWSWTVIGSDSMIIDMVSSLNSGGVLLIDNSNHNLKLYRSDFHVHPYSRMHDLLKEQDGYTYHLANGYGQTVFIKN